MDETVGKDDAAAAMSREPRSVVIVAAGTLGDHVPMVLLARALIARGHNVRLGFNDAMHGLAEENGLEVFSVGSSLGPDDARRHARDWDHWDRSRPLPPFPVDVTVRSCAQIAAACRGADLLLTSVPRMHLAPLVSEQIAIPWGLVAVMPGVFPPPPDRLPEPPPRDVTLATHGLRDARRRLGLADREVEPREYLHPPRVLLASSRHFSVPAGWLAAGIVQTGFWFANDDGFAPEEGLRSFVEDGPAPLVLSFSSLPLTDPGQVLRTHVQAAAAAGRRLVVQSGWAGLGPDLLDGQPDAGAVHFTDYVPHAWLLSRACAVITHAGIGTVAAAIKAGCPILAEPYGNDQFFNAARVVALKLGAAVRPDAVTPEGLHDVLQRKVLAADTRQRVRALQAAVGDENGLQLAADCVQRWLVEIEP